MKKIIIPFIVSVYAIVMCFVALMINSELTWPLWAFFVFLGISIVLAIVNLVVAIKNRKKPDPNVFRATLLVKLIMIPFHIFNFVIMIVVFAGGLLSLATIFFLASAPLLFIAWLISCFGYMVLISTSIHSIFQLVGQRKKVNIAITILGIVLQCVYFADIVISIYLYSDFKKKKHLIENPEVIEEN